MRATLHTAPGIQTAHRSYGGLSAFMVTFKPDFYIIPSTVRDDNSLNDFDGFVYAVVYWYEHLKDGVCTAGNNTIASVLRSTVGSVQNSLNRLEKQGYISRTYKDEKRRVRKTIHCLIRYAKVPLTSDTVPLTGDTQVPLTGEQNKNKSISNRNNTSASPSAPRGVVVMKTKKEKEKNGKAVSSLLQVFLAINPQIPGGMGNKVQRSALDHLVSTHGYTEVSDVVGQLKVTNKQRFMPHIATPKALSINWTRWHDLRDKQEAPDQSQVMGTPTII